MPRNRPAKSGYARLSQADEEDGSDGDYSYDEEARLNHDSRTLSTSSAPHYASITQPRGPHASMHNASNPLSSQPSGDLHSHSPYRTTSRARPGTRGGKRRQRSGSSVDIKAINARLEKWADEIASKFKIRPIKGKSQKEEHLEIHHSVFQAPPDITPLTLEQVMEEQPGRMSKIEYDDVVESVRTAIELGMHPKLITQGSSGSYFARNTEGRVVGVFKPKDEEPYATRNPKWTKWIHRNLFPCFFGRACLIPNLSYVSEAAAYVLDAQLRTNIVPPTDVVHLSSKVFFYDFWQRSAFYRKRKPLPEKPGSFQVFLRGFKDATVFLREHPWPDQLSGGFSPQDAPKSRRRDWTQNCRTAVIPEEDEDAEGEGSQGGLESRPLTSDGDAAERAKRFRWTPQLQQSFREELEKLVILDYIMRNTDRGLDNWMIKVDWETQQASIVADPPQRDTLGGEEGQEDGDDMAHPVPVGREWLSTDPYRRQNAMTPPSRSATPSGSSAGAPKMTLGAIDNSLSWPWKHPDAWRSFPFGWLFLPVSLIGQPFSTVTRAHFLPLLTSPAWWSQTQVALRQVFEQDSDFKERMFARQIAVMKGQAWNVVETLKTADHGPLELTRRTRVCVWDDLVDVPVAVPMERRPVSTELRQKTDTVLRKPSASAIHSAMGGMGNHAAASGNQFRGAGAGVKWDEYSDGGEEMDIGAMNEMEEAEAAATAPGKDARRRDDLMSFDPPASLPNPNKFELSTPASPETDGGRRSGDGFAVDGINAMGDAAEASGSGGKAGGRMNGHAPGRGGSPGRAHARRPSMTGRYGSYLYDGDNDEGDLGYGKAEHTERNTRKVIIERLETVKSANPVFTWC